MRRRISRRRNVCVVLFAVLAVLSVCSRFNSSLAFVNAPGVLVGYLYSAIITRTGPTGWGQTEARLVAFSSAAIYGLVSVWVGTRVPGKHGNATER